MQNSITIHQFNAYLYNLINVFCNPFGDETINLSLSYFRDRIKSQEKTNTDDSIIDKDDMDNIEDDEEKDEKMKLLFHDNETIDSIKHALILWI